MTDKKLAIIGLDCATPQLVFDRWLNDLPNIKKLIDNGSYGPLESSLPAITVPAWMSMMTSKDPGQLGFYGFRNRKNYSYGEMFYATSNVVKDKAAWEVLGEHGYNSPQHKHEHSLPSHGMIRGHQLDFRYYLPAGSNRLAGCKHQPQPLQQLSGSRHRSLITPGARQPYNQKPCWDRLWHITGQV